MTLINPALLMTALEKVPNRIIIFVGHRVVRIIPVSPISEPDRLLGLHACISQYSLLASLDKLADAIRLNVSFIVQTQFFLNLNFDV